MLNRMLNTAKLPITLIYDVLFLILNYFKGQKNEIRN